jgi:hypothetical protein
VIENAVIPAVSHPSRLLLLLIPARQNLNDFLGLPNRHPALVKDGPRFKTAHLKALGGDLVFDKGGKTHVALDDVLFFYVGSGLELKDVEKGKLVVSPDEFARLRGGLAAVVNDPAVLARLNLALKRKFMRQALPKTLEALGLFDDTEGEGKAPACLLSDTEANSVVHSLSFTKPRW